MCVSVCVILYDLAKIYEIQAWVNQLSDVGEDGETSQLSTSTNAEADNAAPPVRLCSKVDVPCRWRWTPRAISTGPKEPNSMHVQATAE